MKRSGGHGPSAAVRSETRSPTPLRRRERETTREPARAAADATALDAREPRRVAIEDVQPAVDGGRFPAKRIVGDLVAVEADLLCDGHDVLAGRVLHRYAGARRPGAQEAWDEPDSWAEAPLRWVDNDRWRGEFTVHEAGWHAFTIEAWPDRLRSWQHDHRRRLEAGQDVRADLQAGAALAQEAALRAEAAGAAGDAQRLRGWADALRSAASPPAKPGARPVLRTPGAARGPPVPTEGAEPNMNADGTVGPPTASDTDPAAPPGLNATMLDIADRHPDRSHAVRHPLLLLWVDSERARASAWYEMFPRSASPDPSRPGTLRDVAARLPYVAGMGFDVLYLPPIHPIGRVHRKGPNNRPVSDSGDPGSPWAIGAAEGGHMAVHPELGTLEDYRALLREAKRLGIDLAFDLAIQCSPDHPWVRKHPEWFRRRPDGSIPSAENPPKRYEDIVALDFECADWRGLWDELLRVVLFWMDQGVRIFRVDNPHTKPFAFWEWLIAEAQARDPGVLFLSEAFTRPKVMARLAKAGFSHSYTYFAWRNGKPELEGYLRELSSPPLREFLRPHLWPNTPDILTDFLQRGGRTASALRLVLAATLAANYGIYGPPLELAETRPLAPGREDYLDSEKYQVRHWDLERPGNLCDLATRLNRVRRQLAPLGRDDGLHFHHVDNDRLLAYSRHASGSDAVLVVVNLDPTWGQRGWTHLDLGRLGLGSDEEFEVHDALNGPTYHWRGPRNYVELDPQHAPAHVFAVRRFGTQRLSGHGPPTEAGHG